jgi:hypothetical protein
MEHEALFDLANPELWVLIGLAAFIGLLICAEGSAGRPVQAALDAHARRSRPNSTKPSNCGKRPRPCSPR